MNNYAPVLISVLNRDIHFKNCVDSLAQNPLAKETHLYIALDAPFAEKHILGHSKVLEYINCIKGFKEVTLFKREKNMGSSQNQFLAFEEIFKKYDRLIFTEDDNVFSPNFLDFINQGLELFKERKEIFSICGHNYLIDIPTSYKSNYYVWTGFDAWGVGLWKDKWRKVDFQQENNKNKTPRLNEVLKLNSIAGHYVSALFQLNQYGIIHDDFAICLHLIKNNMYSVFPTISKVRNNGLDGSGENGGISGVYMNQAIDNGSYILLKPIIGDIPNPNIYHILKNFFKLSFKSKIKLLFRYCQMLLLFKK